MEKLKAIRGGHKSAVTRLINRTDEKIAENDIGEQELSAVIETLVKKRNLLQTLDGEILEVTEVEDMEQEIMDTDEYNLYLDITIRRYKDPKSSTNQTTIGEVFTIPTMLPNIQSTHDINQNTNPCHSQPFIPNSFDNTRQPVVDTNPSHRFYHRLPTLDLPTFSGDILLWQTFWESFESSVHSNTALTNVQKFTYLKSQLQNEAERCISGLSLTNANYEQAICLLKDRFGQQHMIINAFMQNLLELPCPSVTLNSLRSFFDKMEASIRGLESLGQSQDTYGSLLIPIIFGKLPAEMRKSLTREHGSNNWDIRSLREAIAKEMYIQEAGNHNSFDMVTPTASFHAGTVSKYTSNTKQQFKGNQNKRNNGNSNTKSCVYCQQPHSSLECTNIVDREKRYDIIKQKRLCFNCFGNHKVTDCRSRFTCRKCNKKHHTSLCEKDKPRNDQHMSRQSSTSVNAVDVGDNNRNTSVFHSSSSSSVQQRTDVLLKTAVSSVWAGNQSVSTNILLDEGSQKSFISMDLASKLKLKPNGTSTVSLAAFGDANRSIRNLGKAIVDLQTQSGEKISMEVLIVPTIAAPLQNNINFDASKLHYLQGLKLAHPVCSGDKFEISMLIGADYYWDIVQNKIIRGKGPTAVQSRLGYLLSGPMSNSTGYTTSASMLNILIQHKNEEYDLERFWKLESMGVTTDEYTNINNDFSETYETTSIRYKDNRYSAKLPWKEDSPELPSNFNVTKRRTENMINRLSKEPEMLKLYGNIIADQEKRGFIEKVDVDINTNRRIHYIPHHAVKKDSLTTLIRIVYDCSYRESSNKASLNDCLMSVPPKINDLTGIIARFRLNKYAVSTDIEKAFLQIELDENDRDVTRFLWLSDSNDPNSPLITYRFSVVLFGTTCSPFILKATVFKHLKLNPSHTSNLLNNDLYVDNVLSSFSGQEQLNIILQRITLNTQKRRI